MRIKRTHLTRNLKPLFRRRVLRPGTRIRITVAAEGVSGKRFALRVGRNGRARLRQNAV